MKTALWATILFGALVAARPAETNTATATDASTRESRWNKDLDYLFVIVRWLHDSSPGNENTLALLDRCLKAASTFLRFSKHALRGIQNSADFCGQSMGRKRFWQKLHIVLQHPLMGYDIRRVARHEEASHARG